MLGKCIWFVGLSGAGKSTLCTEIAKHLSQRGRKVQVLDADDLRRGLCSDLGYTMVDRAENIRRIAHVARLLLQGEDFVLVASMSPLERFRESSRAIIPDLVEVFVDAPLEICELRDPKGLYRRARSGSLRDLTGVDSPFERPHRPDLVCCTANKTVAETTESVLDFILPERGASDSSNGRRLTVAVDFDGVIAEYDGWRGDEIFGAVREDVILALRELRQKGWKIIVHTTRSSLHIKTHLLSAGVPFDEINTNTDYQNLGQKPVATVYWDDRAVRYSGNAQDDLASILNFRTWNGRG